MDFSIDTSNINMEAPIQDKSLPIKDISDFPSKLAEAIQKHLKDLDEQNKLLDYFKEQYQDLGKPNSLANYILKNWEKDGKKLYLEWTGIETFSDKHTIIAIGIKLNEVTKRSGRYFLWKCSVCQHEWVAQPHSRGGKYKSGCSACAGRVVIPGKNDFGTWCNTQGTYGAKLKSEFMSKLWNGESISINNISKGSNDKVWWKCSKCSYEWTSTLYDRTRSDNKRCGGCPACNGKICIPGVNDFETWCKSQGAYGKRLLYEFEGEDEDKNPILPSQITRASAKVVWWKCSKCEHEWPTSMHNRVGHKAGCPHCCNIGTSFPEQFIFNSLKQMFPDTLNRAKDPIHNFEYDITIPSLRLCIEYSGYGWHKDKIDRDKLKERHCKSHNVHFLQIYAHQGNIKDTDGNIAQDTYTPSQIVYKVNSDKSQRIKQLQHIIKFILDTYAPNHSIEEINFTLVESEANKVMGKA